MWITPKTNWYGVTVDGVYSGDRFNATDFNRIKNNIVYLRNLAVKLYKDFAIVSLGKDKTTADYFYADEINQLEENLLTINKNTIKRSYGTFPNHSANGRTMDYIELNKLESATLDIYNRLTNQYNGRRNLKINFGVKEMF